MYESVQIPSVMKNEKIVHLYPTRYILSILLYVYCIFGRLNIITLKLLLKDIKLKFSVLIFFTACKSVKFQIPRYTGFKVGIFRIQPY